MQISAIIDEGRKFKKSKIRPPMFSGMMYPASRVALVRQLRLCFAAVSDTKLRGILEKKERLRGLLVPHSNLELSGPCAAWAYKAILMTALPKVIVILAPAHVSNLRYHFSVLEKSFRTPLGVAALETKFVKNLARRCDFNITADSAAHWTEHSIEIQLLFLQYIFNCAKKRLKIVPILCGYPDGASPFSRSSRGIREKFLDALRICIHEYGKYVLVVATGDLCHQDRDRPMRGFHARNQKLIRCLGDVDTEFLKKYCIYGKYHTCGGCSFSAFLDLMIPQKGVILNYSWASRTNIIKKEYGERNYFGFAQIGYVSMVF
jgi:AmmeMemoRadiSam system protein B